LAPKQLFFYNSEVNNPLIKRIAMRVIDSRIHGVLDYLMGVLLIASPWLLGFANGSAAQWIPVIVGVMIIGQSLMTDYEMGAVKVIPLPVHLNLDIISGIFLAISPWLFGFADLIYWPHLIFGVGEVMAGLMTRQNPAYKGGLYNKPIDSGRFQKKRQ
jgi:hypothetical protein